MYIDELTEQEKNELAIECGYSKECYTDNVKIGVREELKMKAPDETAILRKAFASLLSYVSEMSEKVLGREVSGEAITDFIVYNANVEQVKINAKQKIE